MGYTTTFDGEFRLDRPLTPELARYLHKFSGTRRMKRDPAKAARLPDPEREALNLHVGPEGCYFVGGQGFRGQEDDESVLDYGNTPPSGQPGLWCQWVPTEDAQGIVWDGGEKFYYYAEWLEYIITQFLTPFGYILNGAVTWQGEDDEDTGILRVAGNVVSTSATPGA